MTSLLTQFNLSSFLSLTHRQFINRVELIISLQQKGKQNQLRWQIPSILFYLFCEQDFLSTLLNICESKEQL